MPANLPACGLAPGTKVLVLTWLSLDLKLTGFPPTFSWKVRLTLKAHTLRIKRVFTRPLTLYLGKLVVVHLRGAVCSVAVLLGGQISSPGSSVPDLSGYRCELACCMRAQMFLPNTSETRRSFINYNGKTKRWHEYTRKEVQFSQGTFYELI